MLMVVVGLASEPSGFLDLPNIEQVLAQLRSTAPVWIYLVVAAGVAIENFFPPIPADTFVVLGAFLSAEGRATEAGIFLVTWLTNSAAALLNYTLARRWGRVVLGTALGRWLLRPRQLNKLAELYHSHGSKMIFASRFLPAFRALVPVFAGISHFSLWRTAFPILAASAIWYGLLVLAGSMFGRNWRAILAALNSVNALLLALAGLLALLLMIIWYRTRHHPTDSEPREE